MLGLNHRLDHAQDRLKGLRVMIKAEDAQPVLGRGNVVGHVTPIVDSGGLCLPRISVCGEKHFAPKEDFVEAFIHEIDPF